MFTVGPILGIEDDFDYTVIVGIPKNKDHKDITLLTSVNGKKKKYKAAHRVDLLNNSILRFEFTAAKAQQSYEVQYKFITNNNSLKNKLNETSWKLVVPGTEIVPKIGFASCNGNDKLLPEKMNQTDFVMWEKLYEAHIFEDLNYSFHCLLLSGDQVYADPIWDNVQYFKDHKLLGMRSTKKVSNHKIQSSDRGSLTEEVEAFYENLYITCWSNPAIAKVLSSIPSVMMWDDHDIFDGWGSYEETLQECQLFALIFEVAKKYFEAFQVRTAKNTSLLSKHSFTQRLSFRNYEILSLDNRSYRTPETIMSNEQYSELEAIRDGALFSNCPNSLKGQKVILFAIPVPVAHLDYKSRVESWLPWLFKSNFRSTLNDDGLDHWDHSAHAKEHEKLIGLIFEFGDKHNPKYVHIASGDVHSAGKGQIKRTTGTKRYVNQLVSSPIVYKPIGKIGQLVVDWTSTHESVVNGYDVGVIRFGVGGTGEANIYDRNFGFLYKAKGKGLKFYLKLENSKKDYEFDQPSSFNP